VDRERVSRLLEEVRESLKVVESIVSLNPSEFVGDARNRYTLHLGVVETVTAPGSSALFLALKKQRKS